MCILSLSLFLILYVRLTACWLSRGTFLSYNHQSLLHKRRLHSQQKAFHIICRSSIYDHPDIYDAIFSYRDFSEEVSFLTKVHKIHALGQLKGLKPRRVLELAAGPARHSIEFYKQQQQQSKSHHSLSDNESVVQVVASDMNQNMIGYGRGLMMHQFGPLPQISNNRGQSSSLQYLKLNMTDFIHDLRHLGDAITPLQNSELGFDSIWCLLGSIAHIHHNRDLSSMLQHALAALKKGGTLILEMAHPREAFDIHGNITKSAWEVHVEGSTVFNTGQEGVKIEDEVLSISWCDLDRQFDPLTQVKNTSFQIFRKQHRASEGIDFQGSELLYEEMVPLRDYTIPELLGLVKNIEYEGFHYADSQQVGLYGSMALYADDDEGAEGKELLMDVEDEDAHRLVMVLTKADSQRDAS